MPTYTTRSDESSVHVEYSRNAMQPTTIDGIAGYYAPVVEIPVDCTKINDNAFENNPTVQTLSFQNPYTEIGSYAFSNCSSLRDVTFPEKLQTISDSAFQDCTGIKELEIPESVESIGNTAFYGCTGMYKLTLHEGLKSIGDTAFYGCSSLINVVIPDGVTICCQMRTVSGKRFSRCTCGTTANDPGFCKGRFLDRPEFRYGVPGHQMPEGVSMR